MEEKKNRSIFRVLLFPLLAVLVGEIALMLSIFFFGGVFDQLRSNMEDILQGQVENRHGYLTGEMVSWSDLEELTNEVNLCVQDYLAGDVPLDALCQDSQVYTPLLNELSPLLIEVMYSKQVSGAFVILAGERAVPGDEISMPGLYFRDRDPQALPSQVLEDILSHRAPHGVIQAGRLSTDSDWKPMFSPEDSVMQAFFAPYYVAQTGSAGLEAASYGYWTPEPYTLEGDDQTAIAYSVPLILPNGRVYGVLGVELLTEYMSVLLPGRELHNSGEGSYLLAVAREGSTDLTPVVIYGGSSDELAGETLTLAGDQVKTGSGGYYGTTLPLSLYSRNAPFDGDQWYLVGCVPNDQLYAFVDGLSRLCLSAGTATLLFGVLGILLVSYRLSRPIQRLSDEVSQARRDGKLPALPDVSIWEIDQLVNAITQLSQEVLESSTRFLSIMDMASVELGGFEVNEDTGGVFVTENYFHLLGKEGVDISRLTPDEFFRLRADQMESLERTVEEDGTILFTVPLEGESVRYVRAEQTRVENRAIGLIEDVTTSVLAKMKVETERDYDNLTGLLSRQGFRRAADRIFRDPERLKTAALLTLDLDRLKGVNDKFGHSAGDSYIRTAGACFLEHTPDKAVCARISGDEFLILYHGYEDRSQIWQQVQGLFQEIHRITFVLPDGTDHGISATGGVAWYPGDTRDVEELVKYSDFAMYCVKKTERGHVGEFDQTAYSEMLRQNLCQQEFYQVLDQRLLEYHFQPIFDSRTGRPFAYEALMRVDMPNLRSPLAVLDFARKTDRMRDVETLTFFCAAETYEGLLAREAVDEKAHLFINSIADTSMTDEDELRFHHRFSRLQPRIVVEITETETLDLDLVRKKRRAKGFPGILALDDYGSGYNTELNLLELNPAFIKVDVGIIRNIHQDENKQQLVRNIVEYAHPRGMKIIAEGLEYPEEVLKSLELGVDLLQGYLLAKPAAQPPAISQEALTLIQTYWASQPKEATLGGIRT